MARKKVNLEYIKNDATRRATFKKRKKGLIKKASELSILCNVKTCVVIYGLDDPKPEVWPSQNEALPILTQFKKLPEQDQCKKMVNQESLLRQSVEKKQEQLRKVNKENKDLELKLLMHELLSGKRRLSDISFEEASELERMIEMRAREVQHRVDTLRSSPILSSNGLRGDELALQGGPHVRPHDELAIIRGGPPHDQLSIIPGPVHDELAVEQPEFKDWFNTSSAESVGCTAETAYIDSYYAFNDYFLPLC